MSTSASLYRRHRPRTFDDVIGQEHVVRTLRNAVDNGKVHHAYLFVGSRGTGKTSMAKILASALNCSNGPSSSFAADDPAIASIADGTSMDVIEMDAASNNGVDEIRDLRERVGFMPTAGNWKVYILDEAHMLTTAAWNAFLKTLEEPPPNTVFVLATTEANKVLATVADRCHRFDFRRPTVNQLSQALRRAAAAEQIEIGDDAVAMIARAATGSFRDALGTLEQLVTYGGTSVVSDDVQAVLGVADFELLSRAGDAIAAGDRREVLLTIGELAESGRDMIAFARDLAGHTRNLLVARTLNEAPSALGLTVEQSQRLCEQAARFGPERLAHTLDLLSQAIVAARGGGDPRLQLELALFKAARPEDDSSPDALIARIESLERRLGEDQRQVEVAREVVVESDQPVDPPPVVDPIEPVVHEEATAAEAVTKTPTIEEVLDVWRQALSVLADESPRLGVALEAARPIRVDGHKLVLGFPISANFARKTADQPACRELIGRHLAGVTGFTFSTSTEQIDEAPIEAGAGPAGIDADELIERLKKEFDATEMAPSQITTGE